MTENEVGGEAALHLEKMFNLSQVKDNCHRSNGPSVVLHLKDPERQEQQEPLCAAPEESTVPLSGVHSSRLKKRMSQHQGHLFDLNCKVCTGRSSCPVGVFTSVTISGRDPRTALSRTCTVAAASHLDSVHTVEARPDPLKPALSSVMLPKSILVKPFSSSDPKHVSVPSSPSVSISQSQGPGTGARTLTVPHLSSIWKGLINMQGVGKFVTKAYPASGSSACVLEVLPDTIHIGGRIAPKTVWDYVGKLQSSVSKELCLIQFRPAAQEEEGVYVSVYSYFRSCDRFGVVANTNQWVKDLYLIPLSAEDPVPPTLLSFAGPGLESPRPDLLLGLVICEKLNHLPELGELNRAWEKQAPLDSPGRPSLPVAPWSVRKYPRSQPCSAAAGTPPPPSPPPLLPPPEVPVLKTLSSLPAGATFRVPTPVSSAPVPGAVSPVPRRVSEPASPLQFILQTLFKGSSFPAPCSDLAPTPWQDCYAKGWGRPSGALLLDPIVLQFGHLTSNGFQEEEEEEEEDRPYDPEEGYNMERASDILLAERGEEHSVKKPGSRERAEVAYDPEDETFLEAARVTMVDLPNVMCVGLGSSSQERPGDLTEHRPPPAQQGHQEIGELKSLLARRQRFPQEPQVLDQSQEALGNNHPLFSRHSRDSQQARPLGESSGYGALVGAPQC
ncbi:death-inducer obliterator 1-like [Octodon degus]|uniref:Death-inducer obliterator 1-like n=1 Tax=Octodon degus TaxID=10160 RepID=A0A6P6DUB5_OCTDE|nr:death-inducer obliterator 1-like [Octodon degus]